MAFYDLHVHSTLSIGEDSVEDMAGMAKRLGLAGIGIVRYYPGRLESLPKMEGMDIVSVAMIKASSPEEMRNAVRAAREKAEIILVHGGDYEINRAACENSMVDILCHPELGRKDSGLDHVCVKAAKENNVAVEINFREILESHRKNRVFAMTSIKRNVDLLKKYGTPVVTNSGAVTKWGMRGGRELASVAGLMGMDMSKAIESVSSVQEEMLKLNREKLSGKRWEGVWIHGGEQHGQA
ncbi:MAG: hypothetical protein HYW27_01320 [Candidatus Aenigmarchaeota archaeon]|nr:hypothetical protein [Candidatus Aenigmarchaeota archaeon]